MEQRWLSWFREEAAMLAAAVIVVGLPIAGLIFFEEALTARLGEAYSERASQLLIVMLLGFVHFLVRRSRKRKNDQT